MSNLATLTDDQIKQLHDTVMARLTPVQGLSATSKAQCRIPADEPFDAVLDVIEAVIDQTKAHEFIATFLADGREERVGYMRFASA